MGERFRIDEFHADIMQQRDDAYLRQLSIRQTQPDGGLAAQKGDVERMEQKVVSQVGRLHHLGDDVLAIDQTEQDHLGERENARKGSVADALRRGVEVGVQYTVEIAEQRGIPRFRVGVLENARPGILIVERVKNDEYRIRSERVEII